MKKDLLFMRKKYDKKTSVMDDFFYFTIKNRIVIAKIEMTNKPKSIFQMFLNHSLYETFK